MPFYPEAIDYILAIIPYFSLPCENHFADVILRPHWIIKFIHDTSSPAKQA